MLLAIGCFMVVHSRGLCCTDDGSWVLTLEHDIFWAGGELDRLKAVFFGRTPPLERLFHRFHCKSL